VTRRAEHKRVGRPPIGDGDVPSARVNVVMSGRQYDHAYAAARREGISVPEVIRRALERTRQNGDEE
jgi:hypothetical protein